MDKIGWSGGVAHPVLRDVPWVFMAVRPVFCLSFVSSQAMPRRNKGFDNGGKVIEKV